MPGRDRDYPLPGLTPPEPDEVEEEVEDFEEEDVEDFEQLPYLPEPGDWSDVDPWDVE